MAILATDNFNRADNADLNANWTPADLNAPRQLQIVSNAVTATDITIDATERYSALVWPNDHYSQAAVSVTGGTVSATNGIGLVVRDASGGTSGTRNFYRFTVNATGTGNVSLCKFINGVNTLVWTRTQARVDGDIFREDAQGTTLRAYYNGVQIGADATDASLATGAPGLSYSSSVTSASVDDWEGGDFSVERAFKGRTARRHNIVHQVDSPGGFF